MTPPEQLKPLAAMEPHERGVVARIDDPDKVLTLIHVGCCPGAEVEVRHATGQEGPMAIHVCGRTVSIRRSAAQGIWVAPAAGPAQRRRALN